MIFHHIGVACESIEEVTIFLKKTFKIIKITDIIYLDNQLVNVCLLTCFDGINIELVSGVTVERFVKNKQFLYHNCWEVEDINASIELFSKNGATLISDPKPSKLFNDRKVAFLYTEIGIVELLEKNKNAV